MAIDETTENLENFTELQRLRDLGRYYLHRDLVAQALQTYTALLEKFPDDVSTLVIVGDSYLMAGDAQAAKTVYQTAGASQPDRKDIQKRINLAEKSVSPDTSIAGGFPPLHPQAINRLAERLTGKSVTIDEEQIRRAAELLEKTVRSESPASSVSEHLDEIDALLPAILELNIRQARSQGRADLAAELIDLQRSLLTNQTIHPEPDDVLSPGKLTVIPEKKPLRAVLIGEPSLLSPLRLNVMKTALETTGIIVEDKWEDISIPWEGYDLVIAHNPHSNPVFMKALAAWAGSGNPILVDMDTDFRMVPTGHPNSISLNGGNLVDTRVFTAALQLADILTFPSTQTALRFSDDGYQAFTVPDGWSEKNQLWMKKSASSAKLNIGIFVESGNLENVASIRRVVIRILREFPQTRLVVSGDPEVYPLFDSIPDIRRIYLPPTEPDDYPFLLAQADIHLFPGKDDELSCLESDRRYMEVGVRKIPWIGSPLPAAEEWTAGGLISRSVDDWYTHLKTLILDNDLRQKLAQEGFDKAQHREAKKMASLWESVVQRTLHPNQPKPFLKEGK